MTKIISWICWTYYWMCQVSRWEIMPRFWLCGIWLWFCWSLTRSSIVRAPNLRAVHFFQHHQFYHRWSISVLTKLESVCSGGKVKKLKEPIFSSFLQTELNHHWQMLHCTALHWSLYCTALVTTMHCTGHSTALCCSLFNFLHPIIGRIDTPIDIFPRISRLFGQRPQISRFH